MDAAQKANCLRTSTTVALGVSRGFVSWLPAGGSVFCPATSRSVRGASDPTGPSHKCEVKSPEPTCPYVTASLSPNELSPPTPPEEAIRFFLDSQ